MKVIVTRVTFEGDEVECMALAREVLDGSAEESYLLPIPERPSPQDPLEPHTLIDDPNLSLETLREEEI